MAQYASKTSVSPGRSREQIQNELTRYGADSFLYAESAASAEHGAGATIGFIVNGRRIRFDLPFPDREESRYDGRNYERAASTWAKAHEQAIRQRWRALYMAIKMKLETVESKITTFDEEFLAHIVIGEEQTLGSILVPRIDEIYDNGDVALELLPAPSGVLRIEGPE